MNPIGKALVSIMYLEIFTKKYLRVEFEEHAGSLSNTRSG